LPIRELLESKVNVREFGEEVKKEVLADTWINRYCESEIELYREGSE
jgi:hypothetical protein